MVGEKINNIGNKIKMLSDPLESENKNVIRSLFDYLQKQLARKLIGMQKEWEFDQIVI